MMNLSLLSYSIVPESAKSQSSQSQVQVILQLAVPIQAILKTEVR